MSKEARPFEEYKEMIKDMRKEEMIKGLYDLSKNIIEKGEEIERLQRQKEELQVNGLRQETLFKLEIKRLNNIINELEKYFKQEGLWHSLDKIKELEGSNGTIPPEVIGTNGENGGLFDYGDR